MQLNRWFARALWLLWGALLLVPPARAQEETNIPALTSLAARASLRAAVEKRQAEEWARQRGLPVRRKLPSGAVIEIMAVRNGVPVYYITYGMEAADSLSADELWPGGSAGLNLTGAGVTLGIWDGGAVDPTHPEFRGRLRIRDGADADDHSTHVGGIMAAAGVNPQAKGMSFAATLDSWDWDNDTAEMADSARAGLLVSNHSYGAAVGWVWDFLWMGDTTISQREDWKFGFYDDWAREWDELAYNAPYYLIVRACGNDRGEGPASQPVQHYHIDGRQYNDVHDVDGGAAGFDSMPGMATSKNALVVGAVHPVPGGYSGPGSVRMSDFSSWGPTDDGRIKPDLVGIGVGVFSTVIGGYDTYEGTSMASPSIAGALGLLIQHYRQTHGGANMRSATLKALAIHTADECGPAPGPDYMFGWGLLNARTAAQVISESARNPYAIQERTLRNGETHTVRVISDGSQPLKVTIVWTDPPGTPPPVSLDPPDRMLVNDLDLRVTNGTTTYLPWVLNPANPAAAATTGDNVVDNVEQVMVPNPQAGVYTITVTHKGILRPAGRQAYSMIVTGAVTYTLQVNSSDPDSGVAIAVSPNDINAQGDGSTPFKRVYDGGTQVTLTAPATAPNDNVFIKWVRNGVDFSTNRSITLTMNADYTLTAVYEFISPVPVLLQPQANAVVSPIPTFRMKATSSPGARMKYKVVIYQGDQQIEVFDQTTDTTGWSKPDYASGEEAVLTVPASRALPTGVLYWQAFAYDGIRWSDGSDRRRMTVNRMPNAPVLVSPATNAIVLGTPALTVRATDADASDTLKYKIVFTRGAATIATFDQTVDATGWSKPGYSSNEDATLTVPATRALNPGTYAWQAFVYDGKQWSSGSESRTIIVNSAPSAPDLLEPAGNSFVPHTPTFRLRATDANGDTLQYRIVVKRAGQVVATFDQTADTTGWSKPSYASGEEAAFTIPASASLATGAYQWQAFATDGRQWGNGSWERSFTVDQAPEAPLVITPAAGAVTSSTPEIRLRSTDADLSDGLRYKLILSRGGQQVAVYDQTVSSSGWSKSSYANNEEAVFRVPASNPLSAGTYQLEAYASDGQQWSSAGFRSFKVSARVPARLVGVGTFAVNLALPDASRSALGVATVPMKVWDANTQSYVDAGDTLLIGVGYWYSATQPASLSVAGNELPVSFPIALRRGWNFIASTSAEPIAWDVSAIKVRRQGEEVTLRQARQRGWIEDHAWGWLQDGANPTTGRYVLVYDPLQIPGAVSTLEPWRGYWVYAHQECELLLKPSDGVIPNTTRATSDNAKAWSIRLVVQSGAGSAEAVFGANANEHIAIGLPPDPPTATPVPRVVLMQNGQPLAVDVRAESRTSATWEVEVQAPAGNGGAATLYWQGVHQAPRTVNPVLVDLQTGERCFLRTTSSHTFAVNRQGGVYRFRIEMAPQGGLLRLSQVRVSGGRSTGGRYTISFNLSASAQVEANILSAGKPVRRLMGNASRSAGIQQITWDGRDANGVALPAGSYMVEIKAVGADGQVVRSTVPITLTR
ncbi:MAG: S8 family serine peptidase [Armatimonadota bacterium]|nr:S8 family serine peptidase [Armatimonadota bacterium]